MNTNTQENAKNIAEKANQATELYEDGKKKSTEVFEEGKETLSEAYDVAKEFSEKAYEQLKDTAADLYQGSKKKLSLAQNQIKECSEELMGSIKGKPFTTVAVASVIGFLAAALFKNRK